MEDNTLLVTTKRHFDLSYDMLKKMILKCPDDLWNEKNGGFIFFQQLLHAISGVNYWMRAENKEFIEPFNDRKLYPELDNDPEGRLSKAELLEYAENIEKLYEDFFENKNDEWLKKNSVILDKISNMDVIFMIMRHIQYHVGHCDSILRDKGREAVEWIDYFGE